MDSEIIGALIAAFASTLGAIIAGFVAVKVKDKEIKAKEKEVGKTLTEPEKQNALIWWGIGGAILGISATLIFLFVTGNFPVSVPQIPTPTNVVVTPVNSTPENYSNLIFQENFDSGKTADWTSVLDGNWLTWQQGDEKNWVYGVQNQSPDYIPTSFLVKSKNWENYAFETDVMFESGRLEQIYIISRTLDGADCTGYRFGGNRYGIALDRLDPRKNCESDNLGYISDYPLVSNRKYNFRIEVNGKEIRCYIDGQLVISAQDDTYPKGGVSIQAYEVKWAYFDNMKVYSIP